MTDTLLSPACLILADSSAPAALIPRKPSRLLDATARDAHAAWPVRFDRVRPPFTARTIALAGAKSRASMIEGRRHRSPRPPDETPGGGQLVREPLALPNARAVAPATP